jgi:cell division protein FtsB
MRRRIVIVLGLMGLIIVALAIALASVGTQVDKMRLNRSDLELDIGDLQAEIDALTEENDALRDERDALTGQVEEQRKTIQQLTAEAEQARTQTTAPAPAAP